MVSNKDLRELTTEKLLKERRYTYIKDLGSLMV